MPGWHQALLQVCQTRGFAPFQESDITSMVLGTRGKFPSFSPAGIDIISTKTKTFNEPDQLSSGEGTRLRGETLMFQTLFQ